MPCAKTRNEGMTAAGGGWNPAELPLSLNGQGMAAAGQTAVFAPARAQLPYNSCWLNIHGDVISAGN